MSHDTKRADVLRSTIEQLNVSADVDDSELLGDAFVDELIKFMRDKLNHLNKMHQQIIGQSKMIITQCASLFEAQTAQSVRQALAEAVISMNQLPKTVDIMHTPTQVAQIMNIAEVMQDSITRITNILLDLVRQTQERERQKCEQQAADLRCSRLEQDASRTLNQVDILRERAIDLRASIAGAEKQVADDDGNCSLHGRPMSRSGFLKHIEQLKKDLGKIEKRIERKKNKAQRKHEKAESMNTNTCNPDVTSQFTVETIVIAVQEYRDWFINALKKAVNHPRMTNDEIVTFVANSLYNKVKTNAQRKLDNAQRQRRETIEIAMNEWLMLQENVYQKFERRFAFNSSTLKILASQIVEGKNKGVQKILVASIKEYLRMDIAAFVDAMIKEFSTKEQEGPTSLKHLLNISECIAKIKAAQFMSSARDGKIGDLRHMDSHQKNVARFLAIMHHYIADETHNRAQQIDKTTMQ